MAQLEAAAGGDPVIVTDDVANPVDTPEADVIDPASFYEDERPESDEQGDVDEQEGGAAEPIAAPVSWKEEEKAFFSELPRDVQEVIARREADRDKFVQSKATEAAHTEQRVMAQVREVVAQRAEEHARSLERYATMFTPQPPDPQLLYTGNPEDAIRYQREEAAFRAATAQQNSLQREIAEARQQAEQLAQQNEVQAAQAELQALQADKPDWFDGSQKLKPDVIERLQPIGDALGYPPELMAQARAVDFKALDTAYAWKVKADKYDALTAKKMESVRAAKRLPPAARPAAQGGNVRQPQDAASILYPNDAPRR